MIRNEYHVFFILIDTSKPQPKISFNFLPDHEEIVVSTNQEVLFYHTYNGSCYYVCNLAIKQWQKILNPKTRYDTIEFGMMVERSKPLHLKIVRFSKPKFRLHDKEFYMFHFIRDKLFD
jgi:hypothetical protein